ncbi:MAG: translation initiation factor IF-6 [Candidatus Nanohaloarchaea archaeon]
MEIQRYNYLGNTNIGFYAVIAGDQAVFPPEFKQKDGFETDYAETYLAKTRLVGLFAAGNSNCILVPDIVTEREMDKLDESGIDYRVIDSNDTALGNLILANDSGAVISPRLEAHQDEIEEALDVEVKVAEIAGIPSPGACGVANSHGVLLHRDTSEEEAELVRDVLEVEEVDIGTVNMGSPYIGSGLLANDSMILVGEDTTGPETGRIDRTLVNRD